VLAAARARQLGGAFVLRMEDLDAPRVVPSAAQRLLADLRWLGLSWAEGPDVGGASGPYVQSERHALYEAAVVDLTRRGLTYLCDCSRAEIAGLASAPHAGEDGPRYPGTCRAHGMAPRSFRRPPALRLAVPARSLITIDDAVLGAWTEDVAQVTGDFVLRRGDGVFTYQLAVVVDDLAMGITEVVRGSDLASSAPRQALLARLLGGIAPRFAHLPLVVGEGGRLSKRARGVPIAEQRAAGRDPRELVRAIASAYGHDLGDRADPLAALAERLELRQLGTAPIEVRRLA
jgi:glutamyl-tRNA synthetase